VRAFVLVRRNVVFVRKNGLQPAIQDFAIAKPLPITFVLLDGHDQRVKDFAQKWDWHVHLVFGISTLILDKTGCAA
jgi:hypothetical protein